MLLCLVDIPEVHCALLRSPVVFRTTIYFRCYIREGWSLLAASGGNRVTIKLNCTQVKCPHVNSTAKSTHTKCSATLHYVNWFDIDTDTYMSLCYVAVLVETCGNSSPGTHCQLYVLSFVFIQFA